ncbi:hypothetical protein HMPREF0326_05801 [Desulfovibrio sp. 3_1_syn3]|uniref:hypothetical protein n=1 Tax=Desulfovibrio sp. 3_1_syn3 TaxID=457398 RepID=UPI00038FAF1F|nr:hypothetical protein [Desulfovibrio sp. 3_1_syn3]EQN48399.1 hypothetical protein HMPREF0326_05801 [Desulfovibrio sp. 3_1_syn3]
MKKNILIICVFVFLLAISNTSFAFNLYGWWKSDECNSSLRIIKFDEGYFHKDKYKNPYKILKSSNNMIEALFEFTPTYSDKVVIKINNDDNITISYPSEDTFTYRRITDDTSISKEKAMEMAGKN